MNATRFPLRKIVAACLSVRVSECVCVCVKEKLKKPAWMDNRNIFDVGFALAF